MKFVVIFSLALISFSALSANSLECPKDSGIKKCQQEARDFCEEKYFKIKSMDSSYVIYCVGDDTGEEIIEEKAPSQKEEIIEETDTKNSKEDKKPEPVDPHRPKWKFAFGLGYNGEIDAESDLKVTTLSSGVVNTGKVKFQTESGYSLTFEGRFLKKNGWGLTMGLDLDLAREVKSGSVTLGGNTVTFSGNSSDPDEISVAVFHGNAVYMWNNFYIPFGFNLSAIDYRATGLDVNTSSSIGVQLGLGFQLDNGLIFELFSRAIGYELDYISNGLKVEFLEGIASEGIFRFKYQFN